MRVLYTTLTICALAAAAPNYLVWPPAQSIEATGNPLPLASNFKIEVTQPSSRLSAAVERYTERILAVVSKSKTAQSNSGLKSLRVVIANPADEKLGLNTNYSYELQIDSDGTAEAKATSVYGAMYAMDTFWQLVDESSGALKHSVVHIKDAPAYQWRGLMIDSGRRFFPMDTVKNLLDTMAGNKMSVLHLHASDECRWSVESKIYPNLTASLTGINAGFYTQEDIKQMISYAGDRGIRVVPEFDVPGHSRGMIPIEGPDGVQFCESKASRSQLYGDPDDKTYKVVHALMKEMASLFTDEVFNIGCDETGVKGPCSQKSTFAFERKLLTAIQTEFGKTPEGWEEIYFDAGAATNETVVNAWARHSAAEITATGRRAVESADSHWYFTAAVKGGPAGWDKCWWDMGAKVPTEQKKLLLGGEMSMWSDTYCDTGQCGAAGGIPVGAPLFDPKHDKEFKQSIGGMIWPRGFVGAAAMWNYNATSDPSSAEFVNAVYAINDKLIAAGSATCPSNCSCDQLSACGKPYLQKVPPAVGSPIRMAACDNPANSMLGEQKWTFGTDGKIALTSNSALCIAEPKGCKGNACYPLKLTACADADTFEHVAGTAEIRNKASGLCLDVENDSKKVGVWECGSAHNQPNQHFAVDSTTGNIIAIGQTGAPSQYTATFGQCVTA